MPDRDDVQREVDQNFEAFEKMLPDLMKTDSGKYALMRNKEKVAVFDTAGDALTAGELRFEDGLYSIQQITTDIVYM